MENDLDLREDASYRLKDLLARHTFIFGDSVAHDEYSQALRTALKVINHEKLTYEFDQPSKSTSIIRGIVSSAEGTRAGWNSSVFKFILKELAEAEKREIMYHWLLRLYNYYKWECDDVDNDPYLKDINVALDVVTERRTPTVDEIKSSAHRLKTLVNFFQRMTSGEASWERLNDQTTPPKVCKKDFCPVLGFRKEFLEEIKMIVDLLQERIVG